MKKKALKSTTQENKVPLFEVEININEEIVENCVIYEGETSKSVTNRIVKKYHLSEEEEQIVLKQLKNAF